MPTLLPAVRKYKYCCSAANFVYTVNKIGQAVSECNEARLKTDRFSVTGQPDFEPMPYRSEANRTNKLLKRPLSIA